MKNKLFPILFIYLSTFNSCDTVDPFVYPPGTRNYDWKVVSLSENAPLNSYFKIWGDSPENIWIIGNAGDFDKTVLRYNGTNITYFENLPLDPKGLFGFSNGDIWISGIAFDFWKFNGTKLSKYSSHPLAGYSISFLSDIWGENSLNVFAVGGAIEDSSGNIKPLIMHFDGTKWNYFIRPDFEAQFLNIKKSKNNPTYYLVGHKVSEFGDSSYFYALNGEDLNVISIPGTAPTSKSIALLDGDVYFNYDGDLYKFWNDELRFVLSLRGLASSTKIWGRNENDLFIQTINGIGHFNGSNTETVYTVDGNFGIIDALILNDNIYFIILDKNIFVYYLVCGTKRL